VAESRRYTASSIRYGDPDSAFQCVPAAPDERGKRCLDTSPHLLVGEAGGVLLRAAPDAVYISARR
jgi:hypothetical protein